MSLSLDPDRPVAGETRVLDGALLVPARRPRNWVIEGGVFDADGVPEPLAQCWHFARYPASGWPELPPGALQAAPLQRGTYLFAGSYTRQFGQFLLESTARLWALDHLDAAPDGLVLLTQPDADRARVTRDIEAFLALCGVAMPPILFPDAPVRLERLVVPKQGSAALDLMLACPEYRTFIARHFGAGVAPAGAERIYISRTRVDNAHGSLVAEARLEALLAAEGYTIYHPQEHALADQVAQYKAAKVVLGVDGSAFHLLALVVRPHQRVVMFQRRPAPEVFLQAEQLRRFGSAQVEVIAADPVGWSPAGIRRSALSVFGTLSFARAGQQLAALGLIEHPDQWQDMTATEQRRAVKAIGQQLGADMHAVKSPRTALAHLPRQSQPGKVRVFSRT